MDRFGGIDGLLAAPFADLRAAGLREETAHALHHPDPELLDRDQRWLEGDERCLLTLADERYPSLLRTISSPPAALFVEGDPDVLWQPQIAVIGSRNPTSGGRDNARDFTRELSRRGLTITSGLASGIDSIAHQAALEAGGQTVAVLGSGLDQVYPESSKPLAQQITEQGVIISEFPPGTRPQRSHFPSRNRIISGLSLGVLVIEAGLRSGTLITARLAGTQGREIFALPGSIHNPMAKGCHRLIRDGARLVENIDDIMGELASLAGQLAGDLNQEMARMDEDGEPDSLDLTGGRPHLSPSLSGSPTAPHSVPWEDDPEYQQLWSCLGYDPKPADEIIEQSGLTARAVSAMLLMLELRGMVEAHPGGAYNRTKEVNK